MSITFNIDRNELLHYKHDICSYDGDGEAKVQTTTIATAARQTIALEIYTLPLTEMDAMNQCRLFFVLANNRLSEIV